MALTLAELQEQEKDHFKKAVLAQILAEDFITRMMGPRKPWVDTRTPWEKAKAHLDEWLSRCDCPDYYDE